MSNHEKSKVMFLPGGAMEVYGGDRHGDVLPSADFHDDMEIAVFPKTYANIAVSSVSRAVNAKSAKKSRGRRYDERSGDARAFDAESVIRNLEAELGRELTIDEQIDVYRGVTRNQK